MYLSSYSPCRDGPAAGDGSQWTDEGLRLVVGNIDAPAPELHLQRIPVNAEDARGLALIPLYAIEDAHHDLSLKLIGGRLQWEALRSLDAHAMVREQHVGRKIVEADRSGVAQRDRALDHVLQLADVAGPRILLQRGERLRGHAVDPLSQLLVVARDEMGDEERYVRTPLPKWRYRD